MPRKPKLPDGMWMRNGVYYARFRAQGREVRKRLSTDFRAACELLNELRSRADKADFGLMDNDYQWAALKGEYLAWAKQTLRKRVSEEYERDLKKFESYVTVRSIRQIQPDLMIGFRAWRLDNATEKQSVCPRTVNRQVGTVSGMLNKGVEWKRIGSNPIAGLKPLSHHTVSKARRSLSVAEVQAIFDTSPAHLAPVWRMFMCTGIRKEELVGMLFSDIDFERKSVTVRASAAKSGKAREIPLDDGLLTMLQQLRSEAKRRRPVPGLTAKLTEQQAARFTQAHVFVTKANTPLRNNLLTRFYAICKRAGIEGAVPRGSVDIHSLRVSFTTLSLEHGANPKAVQAILGHSTLAMTMNVYAKATERSKREAIGALPFASTSAPAHLLSVQNAHTVRTSKNDATQLGVAKAV